MRPVGARRACRRKECGNGKQTKAIAASTTRSRSRHRSRCSHSRPHGTGMIVQDGIDALNTWLAKAGLRGEFEAALVSGFCERAVAADLPISRALVIIDTLHPVYEGRLFRWGHDPSQPAVQEYGRTGLPGGVSDQLSSGGESPQAVARWRASPFFRMLQTGDSLLRRNLTAESEPEFPVLRDYRAAGM